MKAFFHDDQKLHHPQTYFSRGKMRTPQEVPARLDGLVQAARKLGFDVQAPADHGQARCRPCIPWTICSSCKAPMRTG